MSLLVVWIERADRKPWSTMDLSLVGACLARPSHPSVALQLHIIAPKSGQSLESGGNAAGWPWICVSHFPSCLYCISFFSECLWQDGEAKAGITVSSQDRAYSLKSKLEIDALFSVFLLLS